ncbi:MAG: tetratricopeptide repeat protein [Phycisphaerae bacterium]|nr:tetratricopeptide repeat protein [Phycisphaerae bacterium]
MRRFEAVFSAVVLAVMVNVGLAQEVTAGRWLVNHGHSLGLATLHPTVDDAERVLVWMEAAARINPDLAEAYLWQYDLLRRLNRTEAAKAALKSYCKLNPTDITAELDLIDWQFEACQSVEARLAFCAERLKAGGLPPLVRSDLHRRMAELFRRSGDREQAERYAGKALEAFSGNAEAHKLLVELADERDRPVRQVRWLLATIAALPADVVNMWNLARVLDDLSLHGESAKWYERVSAAFERHPGSGQVPVDLLVDFAACHADQGQYVQAVEKTEQVLQVDPNAVEVRVLLVEVLRKMGQAEAADRHLAVLKKQFKELEPASIGQDEPARAYQAAWYYLRAELDARRAVDFAARALELAPESGEVQVVYGLARLAVGEADEAARVLSPLAGENQWAAAGLGEALSAQGKAEESLKVLRAGEGLRYSGPAYERIVTALATRQAEPAAIPPHTAVLQALRGFDERVLSFAAQPERVLRLEAMVSPEGWSYGQRWVCRLRLCNSGPFPISVGRGRMVAGDVLVSLRWGDKADEQLLNYLPLSLALKPVLAAGEAVTLCATLDVGAAGILARSAAQRELTLTFSFLLDPMAAGSRIRVSALANYPAVVVEVKRMGADASRAGMQVLADLLREGAEADRILAVQTLAGLLAEREAGRGSPSGYHMRRVDEVKLRRLLLAALADPTPVVRAAVLDSLRMVKPGPRMLEQMAPLLSDTSWVVRLLGVDVLGETQGEAFRPVLERMSSGDPDELPRRLAGLSLKRLE